MFNQKQREAVADKLMELGNIAIGSLVFGFVRRSEVFSGFSLFIGILIAVATYTFAIFLSR